MNKQINDFTPLATSIADNDNITKQSAAWLTKSFSFATLKSVLVTYFDTLYSKYLGDADFFQYSISRTVSGGNLTVSLLNFEWNTPTPTKPVKIMIWGVLRTITSALTMTIPWGIVSFFNAWSAELATKEIDYFIVLLYDSGTSSVKLWMTRAALGSIASNWIAASVNQTSEKVLYDSYWNNSWWTINSSSIVEHIGMFNAISSAWYVWSIPGTSVIINKPINETRFLDYTPTVTWNGTVPTWAAGSSYKYKVIPHGVIIDNYTWYSSAGTSNTNVQVTLPFTTVDKWTMASIITAGTTPWATYADLGSGSNTATIYTSTLAYVDRFWMNWIYNI